MEGVKMEAKAIAKNVRISPRKAKLVIDLIRGKKVGEAIAITTNVESTVKEVILKVIIKAIIPPTKYAITLPRYDFL